MQLVVDTLHAVDVAALLILMQVAFVELCRRRAWTQIPDGDRVLGLENPSPPRADSYDVRRLAQFSQLVQSNVNIQHAEST